MKTTHILSMIAATLLLGAGAAAAQGVNGPVKPERAPAALQNAPAEKVAPRMNAGEQVPIGTTDQGSARPLKPGSGGNAELDAIGTAGPAPQKDNSGKAGSKGARTDASGSSIRSTTQDSSEADKSKTTGQGAAAGTARLTTEQRTMITAAIKERKVEPVSLNFKVEVGTQIPARVQYHALPGSVVEIHPQWRGYYYILVGNRIVIIEPDKRAVVFIIEA